MASVISRFNTGWMSKEENKNWLLADHSDNTKARWKLCVKTFALSNIEETAVKIHVSEKKHKMSVKKSQWLDSVSEFLGRKDAKPETLGPQQREEPSTSLPSSITYQETSQITKFALWKEQHKLTISWALTSVMPHWGQVSCRKSPKNVAWYHHLYHWDYQEAQR